MTMRTVPATKKESLDLAKTASAAYAFLDEILKAARRVEKVTL